MTDKKDTGSPAFPELTFHRVGDVEMATSVNSGMTLRDWFAGMALQGLLSRDTIKETNNNNSAKWAVMNPLDAQENQSARAYKYADAMIEERKK